MNYEVCSFGKVITINLKDSYLCTYASLDNDNKHNDAQVLRL